jgi:hypothetical protein
VQRFRAILMVLAAVAAALGALWAAEALLCGDELAAGAADLEKELLWRRPLD